MLQNFLDYPACRVAAHERRSHRYQVDDRDRSEAVSLSISIRREAAFDIMMSGDATPSQMGGFLMALRVRGETVEEITGGAMAMRAKMVTIKAPDHAIDTCGTGGDASGTYNISTAASLVVAAAG